MRTLLSAFLLSVSLAIAAESPFVIADSVREKMPIPLREVLKKAEEDYKAILDGKEPIHAKFIEGSYMLDGGSMSYQGERYTITRRHRRMIIGGTTGMLYGPILLFDNDIIFASELSNVRFYSSDEYAKLTKTPEKSADVVIYYSPDDDGRMRISIGPQKDDGARKVVREEYFSTTSKPLEKFFNDRPRKDLIVIVYEKNKLDDPELSASATSLREYFMARGFKNISLRRANSGGPPIPVLEHPLPKPHE